MAIYIEYATTIACVIGLTGLIPLLVFMLVVSLEPLCYLLLALWMLSSM